ncbi:MAG: 4-hydroxybenzoate octaprenyltransferase [Pseudomonadota bacterium]
MAASDNESFYGMPQAPLLRRLRNYALLTRLNRPIGIGLLLWPTLWALWIATRSLPEPRIPGLKLLLVFIAGTVVMRFAGCVINDLVDRDIDPHVRRTKGRPLATRQASPHEALALFGVLVATALLLVMQLDRTTVLFSLVGAALTVSYPFTKRFFPLPQFWLGAAFGWAVPMAFVATLGEVPRVGWLMFIVTVLWAGIYDTQYAMVDRDDDVKLGVHSTAIAFGDLDTVLIGVMQLMVLGGLLLVGRMTGLGWQFPASLGAAAALFLWQQWLTRHRERDGCFKAFLNNNWVGLAVLAGIIAS